MFHPGLWKDIPLSTVAAMGHIWEKYGLKHPLVKQVLFTGVGGGVDEIMTRPWTCPPSTLYPPTCSMCAYLLEKLS